MPVPYQLTLSAAQQAELVQTRDHAAKAYLRERAAVLLKICQRIQAPRSGPQRRFESASPRHHRRLGPSLRVSRAGRAAHPRRTWTQAGFSPLLPPEQAQAEASRLLEQSPWQAGRSRSRWWLDGV